MKSTIVALLIAAAASAVCSAQQVISLDGSWQLKLDREDVGISQEWFSDQLATNDSVRLPGSIQEQRYGDIPSPDTPWTGKINYPEWDKPKYAPYRTADNFKMPFWLQPDRYYKGPAWYQRTIDIPNSWTDKQITLFLERPHWQTTVWLDSKEMGTANSLSTPHLYDLSGAEHGKHTLTIRIDNREVIEVGLNAHSISDHTQSNWNGIIGRIQLQACPAVCIDDVQLYPNVPKSAVKVLVSIKNNTGKPVSAKMQFAIKGKLLEADTYELKDIPAAGSTEEITLLIKNGFEKWDEFNPYLYSLKTKLKTDFGQDEKLTTFGMRQIATDENHFMLNSQRIFMRGTLECCIFPKTGYPPTDIDSWKRVINICKAHGLNHIRFHSWCPPEAAFDAADELGFYYQVECSAWVNGKALGVGLGKPVDQWLYQEADAILKAYGNHPSFVLFAYGNEPGGPGNGAVYLKDWVAHYKNADSRRLITSASGWPSIEENQYHVTPSPRIRPRIKDWGEKNESRINSQSPETVTDYADFVTQYPNQPVIAHEIGQWCVYPNFDEMKKYTGILKPKNFEIYRDFLKQKGMLDQAHDFFMASGKLQTLCYKEEIESALRTRDFGGFQLLDLHDFPGQGTALVGVLDPFWDSKPYVTPREYSRFCGPIVPLVRLPKRMFTSSETLKANVEISHYGPADLQNAKIKWILRDGKGKNLRSGTFITDPLLSGGLRTIDTISLPLEGLPVPAKYNLLVKLEKTKIENDWDIWVYPDSVQTDAADGITIARSLDESAIAALQNGGKVLLAVEPSQVNTDVLMGFSSIFWNTAWTNGQGPHTLGILCDPKHPALAKFPTEYHTNWQWSELMRPVAPMRLELLSANIKPIVQAVPDWFSPQNLGLVFEAKAAGGSIIVCSIDIATDLETRPVARQLRHSLLTYMQSNKFNPQTTVDIQSLGTLLHKPK